MKAVFPTTSQGASAGAELVAADGRMLALRAAALRVDARGGIARCVLEQTFENRFAERLHVTYRMPLPADGAVSGYAFTLGQRVVRGVVDRKQRARERFELAIASGKTAGLLEQERADIFTQQLGNIPPGETLVVCIEIDQRLVWLPEGEWELRFPTVIGPRYIGAADTLADAQATHVKVAAQPLGIAVSARVVIGDAITGGRRASSPSHALTRGEDGALALGGGARLDRDIVVRWPVTAPSPGLALAAARPTATSALRDQAFGLLTIVPPARDAQAAPVPRDLIVLLDTSGSMDGGPLEKAKQVVALLIDSLTERDRFELIEFNISPARYLAEPEHATAAAKKAALRWVASRTADGGTEMRAGVLEALRTLRLGAQRQVIVVTDGYVGGEEQILTALQQRLPASCRLHVLGVGSAVNRSLATALARVGRGAEVIVGVDEDPERGAKRLLDRTAQPMLTNVTISGDALVAHAPEHIPDVFAGAPCVAALMLSTEGGEIVVRGETASGAWEQRTRVLPLRAGEGNQGIVALYGRERVADLEARSLLDAVDASVEEIGLEFQIATRLTSWVAIDELRVTDGPERTQNVPQELPYGTRAAAFGLRGARASEGEGGVLLKETSASAGELVDLSIDSDLLGAPPSVRAPARPAPAPAPAPAGAARGAPPRPGMAMQVPVIPRVAEEQATSVESGDDDFFDEALTERGVASLEPAAFDEPTPSSIASYAPASSVGGRPPALAQPVAPAPIVSDEAAYEASDEATDEATDEAPLATGAVRRAPTSPGVGAPSTREAMLSLAEPRAEDAKVAPPSPLRAKLAAAAKAAPGPSPATEAPAPGKRAEAPALAKRSRRALWLIVALVLAILAALAWWLAS